MKTTITIPVSISGKCEECGGPVIKAGKTLVHNCDGYRKMLAKGARRK